MATVITSTALSPSDDAGSAKEFKNLFDVDFVTGCLNRVQTVSLLQFGSCWSFRQEGIADAAPSQRPCA